MKKILPVLIVILLSNFGCGFYKLNPSGDIDSNVHSISITYFENRAPLVAPALSPMLTEKIRDKFVSQTELNLVESGGDMHMEGEIVDYSVMPVSSQDNSIATQNRLTIRVSVKLSSDVAEKHNFEQTFTQFQDFDASQNLASVENELIDEITDVLVQEIFNKSTRDW